jgi:hypothetical protein
VAQAPSPVNGSAGVSPANHITCNVATLGCES